MKAILYWVIGAVALLLAMVNLFRALGVFYSDRIIGSDDNKGGR